MGVESLTESRQEEPTDLCMTARDAYLISSLLKGYVHYNVNCILCCVHNFEIFSLNSISFSPTFTTQYCTYLNNHLNFNDINIIYDLIHLTKYSIKQFLNHRKKYNFKA